MFTILVDYDGDPFCYSCSNERELHLLTLLLEKDSLIKRYCVNLNNEPYNLSYLKWKLKKHYVMGE